jgi:hypothetical protein
MTAGLLIGLIALTVAVLILTNRYRVLLEDRDYWHHRYTEAQRSDEIDWLADWPPKPAGLARPKLTIVHHDELEPGPADSCRLCSSEDSGRMTAESQVCIDCADDRKLWPEHANYALIVDDIYQWRRGDGTHVPMRDFHAWRCAHCEDLKRAKELDGALCSACSTMAIRWYTKPLPDKIDRRHNPYDRPARAHKALVKIGHYNDYDYINHWTSEWIEIPNAIEILEAEQRGEYDERIEVVYLPPAEGPREGSRAPAFRSDFAPSGVADDDDLPF